MSTTDCLPQHTETGERREKTPKDTNWKGKEVPRMAAASVRRPLPPTAAETLNPQRRNLPFSSVFHLAGTPPDPSSPTNSIGSTGGLIYRDERETTMDLLNLVPNTLLDTSPVANSQQSPANNASNNAGAQSYPRATRVPPPAVADAELDPVNAQPNGISPANSLRRMTKEGRGSSGSVNELGIDPAAIAAAGAARERDRPSSRDRDRRDREKINSLDKTDRKASVNSQGSGGSGNRNNSPYSFDSTMKNSTTDLLGGTTPVHNSARDSPVNSLGSMDSKPNEGATPPLMMHHGRQGSMDSLELPNGERGGWVSYDTGPSPPPLRQEPRNPDKDRNQANQAFTASRFSPDRFPLAEELDGRDEEILSPRNPPNPPNRPPIQSQSSQQSQQSSSTRRQLPMPNQSQNLMNMHARDPNSLPSHHVVPVPKTQNAQIIQAHNWTRRPSSPLAREPVVQGATQEPPLYYQDNSTLLTLLLAQNTSSEESDSYTPRSPHAALPEIPSLTPSYASNGTSSPQQYQPAPQASNQHQHPANARPMAPPALVRPRQQQVNMYEQHRGMTASMQLPMYTGASMATALSSISPSQSVSAVGSPHPQSRVHVGPPFGPPSTVFVPEGQRVDPKHSQLYSLLQQQAMKNSSRGGRDSLYSLDQQIAALTGQGYPPLNAQNLAALRGLSPQDLQALGFGRPQPANPLRSPKAQARGGHSGQQQQQQQQQQRPVIEALDKAAGEVVELQDLQRAMEMNLENWEGRDWQGHHRPVHTGNSAQYPSSHAVLPPGDRNKHKQQDDYEQQLHQLAAMGINLGPAGYSSSQMANRPINPIPPTSFSGHTPTGQMPKQEFPRVLGHGEGWIPVPNTDGYPPSYGELISLYEQHNPGKQPSTRDVLLMQLAALASEPENVEGSVFSKSETPFPPVGFNPFLPQQSNGTESTRSSPRDPPGEFDKMLRRVGTFNQPPRRTVGSSVYGGDGETEVSRMAPSTATEGTTNDDEGRSSGEETESNEKSGGLRLNFDNSTTDTLGMSMPMPNNINEPSHSSINDLYPLISGMLKSRAASVAPVSFPQPQVPPPNMGMNGGANGSVNGDGQWVEEVDSDEDLETELEMWGDEDIRLHPRFIRDEAKRRRKWEIKFAELVKAFHELDRLTDTPMILLATPPRSSGPNATQPMSHIALSRSIKRDVNYIQRAHDARQSYHNILMTPPTSRAESFQSLSPPSMSPPPLWGGGRGWASGSAASGSDADAQMRAQMMAALGSLRLMSKVEERREERRRQEITRQKDEREGLERMLKSLLTHSTASAAGSIGVGGSVSAGSPARSIHNESVGVPASSDETTPQPSSGGDS